MAAPLSQDLRRIVRAVEKGSSIRQAAARYEVSASAAVKLMRRLRETGSVTPDRIGGHRRPVLEPHQDLLQPDALRSNLCHSSLDHAPPQSSARATDIFSLDVSSPTKILLFCCIARPLRVRLGAGPSGAILAVTLFGQPAPRRQRTYGMPGLVPSLRQTEKSACDAAPSGATRTRSKSNHRRTG